MTVSVSPTISPIDITLMPKRSSGVMLGGASPARATASVAIGLAGVVRRTPSMSGTFGP